MSFITDPTGSIYDPKVNWRERPSVRTVEQWVSAEDLNQVRGGMLELRDSVVGLTGLAKSLWPTDTILYCRPSGSDITGDGSIGNPYRTLLKSLSVVPAKLDNNRYWIDMTGVTEYIPAGTHFPVVFGMSMASYRYSEGAFLNIEFTDGIDMQFPPPSQFDYCAFAENLNVIARPNVVAQITASGITLGNIDNYSGLQRITPGGWAATPGQYANMFLTCQNNPHLMIPITDNSADTLFVTAGADDIPFAAATMSFWEIVEPSAKVVIVPGSGSLFGLFLGGRTGGTHWHGLKLTSMIPLSSSITFGNSSAPYMINGCHISGSNTAQWGNIVIDSHADVRAYQSIIAGADVLGGATLLASYVNNQTLPIRSARATRGAWGGLPSTIGIRWSLFNNGSYISDIGKVPGIFYFKHMSVSDQQSMTIGWEEEGAFSQNMQMIMENVSLINQGVPRCDLTIVNCGNIFMSGVYVDGFLDIDEESKVIVHDSYIGHNIVVRDNSVLEFYDSYICVDMQHDPGILSYDGSKVITKNSFYGNNSTIFCLVKSELHGFNNSGSYDSGVVMQSGAFIYVDQNSKITSHGFRLFTGSYALPSGTSQIKCGTITGSAAELAATGTFLDETPGHGRPQYTYWTGNA